MRYLALILVLLFLPICVYAEHEPTWSKSLPQVHGKVYGVGIATLTSPEAKALEIATQSARFEVIARLKSRVEGNVSSQTNMAIQRATGTPTNASSQQLISSNSKTSVLAEDLPGLVIEERYIEQKTRTVYVLAYLDIIAAEVGTRDGINALKKELESLSKNTNNGMIAKIQSTRNLQDQAIKTEGLASLIMPFGKDTSLRQDAQSIRFEINNILKEMQKNLTVGLISNSNVPSDLKSILREAVTKEGLIWSNQNPSIILDVNMKTGQHGVDIHRKAWWESDYRTDFIVLRVALNCAFSESDGTVYGSFDLDAKGVGTDEFTASRALMKELRKELPRHIHNTIAKQLQN